MTIYIVHKVMREPEAAYLSKEEAHKEVLRREGKYNVWEVTELEVKIGEYDGE